MMLPPDMRRLLDDCGLPWRLEEGSRHIKVVIAERMVTILPKGNHVRHGAWRQHRNALTHIKRGIEKLERER